MPLILVLLLSLLSWSSAAETVPGEPTNAKEAAAIAKAKASMTPQEREADDQRLAAMAKDERAWEQVLEANLGSFYLPLYKRDKLKGHETAWDYVRDDPALPRLLIIGDSISRGYTLAVRHALAGKVNVHRAPANCGPTATGIKMLDVWLGEGRWDVIHFNFGIHDRATPAATYAANLETLIARLEKTGAKLIWARTTPAPPASAKFTQEECRKVNDTADQVMLSHRIPATDLHALLLPRLPELQNPDDVHFKEPGYELMGREVAAAVLKALGR